MAPTPSSAPPSVDTRGLDTKERKTPLGTIARGIAWTLLILLGALLSLAAVSTIVSAKTPPEGPPSTEDAVAEIQASNPSPVVPPNESLAADLIPLPLSGGQSAYPKDGMTIIPIETQCDIERVLEWSRPGGAYCAVTLALYGQGLGTSQLKADEQAIYPLDPALMGYRGSFFITKDNVPRRTIDVTSADETRVVLITDTPRGFRPAYIYLRSTLGAP